MHSPEVLVISAGGTIDKIYRPSKGTHDFSFGSDPAIVSIANRARFKEWNLARVSPKDSLDMNDHDREFIASVCASQEERFIIVTHGTDTMIETACIIARRNLNKTIVLTGSSQPESMKNSDADFNFGYALGVLKLLPIPGVYIAMNGQVFVWNKCRKRDNGTFGELNPERD